MRKTLRAGRIWTGAFAAAISRSLRSKRHRRGVALAAAGALLVLALTTPLSARAQDAINIAAEQRITIRYGETLVFDLSASPPSPIVTAQLAVLLDGQRAPHIEGLPLTENAVVNLTAEVPVQDLDLPPVAGLTYWWELIDRAGQRYRTSPQYVRYHDTIVPWSWEVYRAGDITVYSDGTSHAVVEAAHSLAASAQAQASRMLSAPPGEIHVYVYPELSLLAASLRRHELTIADWVAAYAVPAQDAVLVAAAPGPDMLATLSRDIPHEVFHVVVGNAAGNGATDVPGWLAEGLAVAAEGAPDPTLTAALDEAVGGRDLLPLDTLCAPRFTGFSPQQATLAYAQSSSLVRYLLDRYGTSAFRAYLAALNQGESCSGASVVAFGAPLAGIETQWHNALMSQAARASHNSNSVIPWLVVWGMSLLLAMLFVAPQPERTSG